MRLMSTISSAFTCFCSHFLVSCHIFPVRHIFQPWSVRHQVPPEWLILPHFMASHSQRHQNIKPHFSDLVSGLLSCRSQINWRSWWTNLRNSTWSSSQNISKQLGYLASITSCFSFQTKLSHVKFYVNIMKEF
jgi:hypothetical protein